MGKKIQLFPKTGFEIFPVILESYQLHMHYSTADSTS